MFERIKDELTTMFEERYAAIETDIGVVRTRTRDVTYSNLSVCEPPLFEGKKDIIMSMRWMADVESVIH